MNNYHLYPENNLTSKSMHFDVRKTAVTIVLLHNTKATKSDSSQIQFYKRTKQVSICLTSVSVIVVS